MNKEHVWFLVTCVLILLTFYIFGICTHANEIDLVHCDSLQDYSPYSKPIEIECTYYYPTGNLTYKETVPKHMRTIAMNPDFIHQYGFDYLDTVILYYQNELIGYYIIEDKGAFSGGIADIYVDDTTDWTALFYKDLKQKGRLKTTIQIVKADG